MFTRPSLKIPGDLSPKLKDAYTHGFQVLAETPLLEQYQVVLGSMCDYGDTCGGLVIRREMVALNLSISSEFFEKFIFLQSLNTFRLYLQYL